MLIGLFERILTKMTKCLRWVSLSEQSNAHSQQLGFSGKFSIVSLYTFNPVCKGYCHCVGFFQFVSVHY